jgi:hypothetical protein
VWRNDEGEIIFDPGGQGYLENGVVNGGGHVWFPVFESVKSLLGEANFSSICFYHFFDEEGEPHLDSIDYRNGFVRRTPDHDKRVQSPRRPLSIVVDAIK